MQILVLFVIWCLGFGASAFASPQAGADIAVLNAGVGARPLGMGGAFTSIADNADAPYWNPAGLSQIQSHEVTSMQARLSADTDYYYLSYAAKFLNGAIGISWIQMSLGNISQTTTTDAFNEVITTGVFSYFSNAYLLSYGFEVSKNISLGITGKYLTSDMGQIAGAQSQGYSITPGILLRITQYTLPIAIGFKLDELFNEQKWGTSTIERSPPKARIGVSTKDPAFLPKGTKVALDVSQTLKNGFQPEAALGLEWESDGLSLRGGLMDSQLTAGAGFESGMARLDYAYVEDSALSKSNVHRISLSGKW